MIPILLRLTPAVVGRFAVRHAIFSSIRSLFAGGESARLDLRALMPEIRVKIEAPELERLLAGLDDPKVFRSIRRGAVRAAATVAASHARATAPYRSGALKLSIRVRTKVRADDVIGLAIAGASSAYRAGKRDAYYAAWVESGTKPHVIRAGDGLRGNAMVVGGRVLRVVRHPGTKPARYMRQAAERSAPLIGAAMDSYVARRIERLQQTGS